MPPRVAAVSSSDISQNYSSETGSTPVDNALPVFFNTTFSTHRVSPLFVGREELSTERLAQLAHRLRDTLVGDVVRGIQIGLESTDTPAGQVGSLRSVTIRWFEAQRLLGGDLSFTDQDGGDGIADSVMRHWSRIPDKQKRGLWIEIRHENAAYMALLLPGYPGTGKEKTASSSSGWTMQMDQDAPAVTVDQDQFLQLPLLLLRMPQALKGVIGDWLSTTFDCRVSKLNLGTRTLVTVWEDWLEIAGLPGKGPDFAITLAFNAPLRKKDVGASAATTGSDHESELSSDDDASADPGLRSMDVTISTQDLRRFLRAGQQSEEAGRSASKSSNAWDKDARERRRLAGGNTDDGWGWRSSQARDEHPFTEALARYLDHHLGLNLFHPSVRVVQISCGGFVLAQSRLKIVKIGDVTEDLARAAWVFVTRLGERLRGDTLLNGWR